MKENVCLISGDQVNQESLKINPDTGMQYDYVVLTSEERAKGFVRPVRFSYQHVGMKPKYQTRELTDEEKIRHEDQHYVLFEIYPESELPITGRFWTKEQLLSNACYQITTIHSDIAETYARNPKFYGSTYCCYCTKHLPVEEFVWSGTNEILGS